MVMADDPPPWRPLAEILEQKLSPTPGLKAKQERLLQKLASDATSEAPAQPAMWTPEQELEDGKFRRARILQQLGKSKSKGPSSSE